MRSSVRQLAVALACTLALAACGSEPSDDAASREDSAATADRASEQAGTAEVGATTIPDDFPLSAGMGGPQDAIPTLRTGTGLRDLTFCSTAPLRGLGLRDRMVADNSGGESADTREVVLLGSPDEAALVARAFAELPVDCEAPVARGLETVTEVRASPFGAEPAATLLQTYTLDGDPSSGATVIHVVPVGAALLVTSTYGDWSRDDLEAGVEETVTNLGQTVTAMAMFDDGTSPSDEASPEPTEPASPPASAEIPDDFPLLAGWPEDSVAEDGGGREGPSRTADSLEFRACGERWHEPDHVDRLRADWVNAEDYRSRQLTTYPDAAAAIAAVEELVGEQRACPSEPPGEDGYATTRAVRSVALGDEAWAILERDTFHGSPSAFGGSALVVRVGRSVLAVRHEGHAGYPEGDGQRQVGAMGSQATEAIDQMCVFTETGC